MEVSWSWGSVLRFSLGRGDSSREEEEARSASRTEPGLEVGSLGGSGGGWSTTDIKLSLHCMVLGLLAVSLVDLTRNTAVRDDQTTKVLSTHSGDHRDPGDDPGDDQGVISVEED